MKLLLLSIGVVAPIVLAGVVALAVFTPPDTTVFRPSSPGEENVQIREVGIENEDYVYPLHFVEFDDEGFYADIGQKQSLLDTLRRSIAEESEGVTSGAGTRGTIILLYVHGLNHNARAGNENVNCFGELLDAVAMMQGARGVNVVGVYVGWPGLVYDNSNLNAVLAYLGREAAADRIAERGDLLDLFTSISRVRHMSKSKHTRFTIIGHSLGGRATYMALRPIMQRSIDEGSLDLEFGKRIADVTVFANPAFSAVEHSSLKRIMSSAVPDMNTLPRFIMLTSEADEVLRGAFQVSQKLTSFFRGDYGLNEPLRWTAAGQHLEYITHDLRLEGGEYINPEGNRSCSRLDAKELEIIKGRERVASEEELYDFAEIQHYSNEEKTYRTTLRRVSERAAGEAMVVQVDAKIIPNHNDIFTTPIVDFIARILNCGYFESFCLQRLASLDEITLYPEGSKANKTGNPE